MCNCELPEFSSTSIRTARKTHKCCECDRVVNPGDKYEYFTGKFDGGMFTYKTCLTCSQVRKWLARKIDCCIEFEGLITELIVN